MCYNKSTYFYNNCPFSHQVEWGISLLRITLLNGPIKNYLILVEEKKERMVISRGEKLSPAEELDNLKSIYGENQSDRLYKILTDSFNVLQNRAQMLLSLITITLTITGFSGPRIAESGLIARFSIVFGLVFVLVSALILIVGPLRLRWSTQLRSGSIDRSLIKLIEQRNIRTWRYHIAAVCLVIGLIGYVTSVISYLVTG